MQELFIFHEFSRISYELFPRRKVLGVKTTRCTYKVHGFKVRYWVVLKLKQCTSVTRKLWERDTEEMEKVWVPDTKGESHDKKPD